MRVDEIAEANFLTKQYWNAYNNTMAYLFVHNRVAHSWVHLCVCVWPTETDHKMAAIKQSAQQLQLSTRCRRRKWLSL